MVTVEEVRLGKPGIRSCYVRGADDEVNVAESALR